MTVPPEDGGVADLVAALDALRRQEVPGPAAEPSQTSIPRLGRSVSDLDFVTALFSALCAGAYPSPTITRWIAELAPADAAQRTAAAAASLLDAFSSGDELLVMILDALVASEEQGALALALRFTAAAAVLDPARASMLSAVFDARLTKLCELVVDEPAGPLPAVLAVALKVAPSHPQAVAAIALLDEAPAVPQELVLVVNGLAVAFWDELAAREGGKARFPLALELARHGDNLRAGGRSREALVEARRALVLAEDLVSGDFVGNLGLLVFVLGVLVAILRDADRLSEAGEALERAAESVAEAVAGPGDLVTADVLNDLSRLATLAHNTGRGAVACRVGGICLDLQTRLRDPSAAQQDAFCRSTLMLTLWLLDEGDDAEALRILERAAVVAARLAGAVGEGMRPAAGAAVGAAAGAAAGPAEAIAAALRLVRLSGAGAAAVLRRVVEGGP